MKKTTISQLWEQYRTQILVPENAPPIQVSECQNAFYCGIAAIIGEMVKIGHSDVTDDEGALRFKGFMKELAAYLTLTKDESYWLN